MCHFSQKKQVSITHIDQDALENAKFVYGYKNEPYMTSYDDHRFLVFCTGNSESLLKDGLKDFCLEVDWYPRDFSGEGRASYSHIDEKRKVIEFSNVQDGPANWRVKLWDFKRKHNITLEKKPEVTFEGLIRGMFNAKFVKHGGFADSEYHMHAYGSPFNNDNCISARKKLVSIVWPEPLATSQKQE